MHTEDPESGGTGTISCGDSLEISMVQNLYNSLKQALAPRRLIVLDGSKAETINSAALQLLCAFVRKAAASGREILWHQPTQERFAAAGLFQIMRPLRLPHEG